MNKNLQRIVYKKMIKALENCDEQIKDEFMKEYRKI